MRDASGRDRIAGVEWQPIIDVTDMRPNPNDALYRAWAAGIRSHVNETVRIAAGATPLATRRTFWHDASRTLVIDCADEGLPSESEYADMIGALAGREDRPVGLVECVVIWVNAALPETALRLTAEGFTRDDSRMYEIDCRREIGQGSAGQRTAWVTHIVKAWGKKHKKAEWVPDNRPVEEKLAEAEAWVRHQERAARLEAAEDRAWRARMERGEGD